MKEYLRKLSKVVLFLFLLLIPTQLGKHFWFDWSLVLGIRIDYLSPTLYLIDLIWVFLFLINLIDINFLKIKRYLSFKFFWIFCFVLINIFVSSNRWVAGMGWLRVFQIVWMICFLNKNKVLVKKNLVWIIPIWIIIESGLAIGQISKGGSLGGWWWWLGERSFDFNTIGIAQMSIIGNGLIRAYGTFSHPNSLAGFLLVVLIWWNKSLSPSGFLSLKKGRLFYKVWWWVVFWLGLVGIILTGSRTVWILTLVALVWFFKNYLLKIKKMWKASILVLFLIFLVFKIISLNYSIDGFLSGWDENGLLKRGQLNLAALEMIKSSPIFGIGIKNFLTELPNFQKNNYIFWLQPVHNILFLILSEVGFLGLGILIWALDNWFKTKKLVMEDWLVFGVILISGMMDHYWLTLPQNMWLLAVVLGLI